MLVVGSHIVAVVGHPLVAAVGSRPGVVEVADSRIVVVEARPLVAVVVESQPEVVGVVGSSRLGVIHHSLDSLGVVEGVVVAGRGRSVGVAQLGGVVAEAVVVGLVVAAELGVAVGKLAVVELEPGLVPGLVEEVAKAVAEAPEEVVALVVGQSAVEGNLEPVAAIAGIQRMVVVVVEVVECPEPAVVDIRLVVVLGCLEPVSVAQLELEVEVAEVEATVVVGVAAVVGSTIGVSRSASPHQVG